MDHPVDVSHSFPVATVVAMVAGMTTDEILATTTGSGCPAACPGGWAGLDIG
jgi:hypothetical protein